MKNDGYFSVKSVVNEHLDTFYWRGKYFSSCCFILILLGSYKPPLTIKELDSTIIHKISDKEIITEYFGGDNSTKTTQFNLDNLLIPNHF